MKKLPYGKSDYKDIVEKDMYYIDKTHFIDEIEAVDDYLFFIRPRRFGKSLWLSLMSYYYDMHHKDNFEKLFKDTYIGANPTQERNSYFIMKFDFSAVDSDNARESLNDYCNDRLREFLVKYEIDLKLTSSYFINNLNKILIHSETNEYRIYVIIDEYDNFINKILISSQTDYENFITDREGIYKQFFTTLKSGTGGMNAPIKKMFITGVSPMALYDVTSGNNIMSNISTDRVLNDMVGITKEELNRLIEYYDLKDIDYKLLEYWYNNYKFNADVSHTIYNTDMVLYYVKNILYRGEAPRDLIDVNVRSDYSKLRYLVYTNNQLNGNFQSLQELIYKNQVPLNRIVDTFSALDLKQEENFKSLMFYLGLATIDGDGFETFLKIPNETVKRITSGYIKESLEKESLFNINIDKFGILLAEFAKEGSLKIFEYFASEIKKQSGVRDYMKGELFVKSMHLVYLSFNHYFTAKSEYELNKGFADISLLPLHPRVTYFAIIELKYISRSIKDAALQKEIQSKKADAIQQLNQYQNDAILQTYKAEGKKLKKIIIIYHGWEMVCCEALSL